MRWSVVVRAWGAVRLSSAVRVCAVAAVAACAAGCSSSPSNGRLSLASAATPGSTIAFESVDGPPPEVFGRLVTALNDEAGTRHIAVASRSAAATYRIRGYLSALVERDKTMFAWVWDVYDADKRRVLRISGQEPAGAVRRRDAKSAVGAWTAADEQVLRRMTRSGMEQIAGFLNSGEPPPSAAPEPNLVTLVSGHDDSPEAAGIFRVFSTQDQPPDRSTAEATPPPPPPEPAKIRSAAAGATTDGRSSHQ